MGLPIANKPQSSSQRALQELRNLIFSGELAAGSDHLETELAEKLNMSRTPVREALLVLEAQGLAEMRPRKGVRISPISPADMAEIYDVLTELESHAAEKAAQSELSANDLVILANAIDDMDKAISDSDLDAWARADECFHQELVRLCGNSRIRAIYDMMSDQVRRARAMTLLLRPLPTQSNKDHRKVYQAIKDRDPKTARETHSAHRREAKDIIVSILEKHRLRYI